MFDRFRKKKTREEVQAEIDALIEEEDSLDFKKGYDKISKRVAGKRRSQSTVGRFGRDAVSAAGKIGRGVASAADTVFGGPPPKSNKKSKAKKKKEEDDWFIPFI